MFHLALPSACSHSPRSAGISVVFRCGAAQTCVPITNTSPDSISSRICRFASGYNFASANAHMYLGYAAAIFDIRTCFPWRNLGVVYTIRSHTVSGSRAHCSKKKIRSERVRLRSGTPHFPADCTLSTREHSSVSTHSAPPGPDD